MGWGLDDAWNAIKQAANGAGAAAGQAIDVVRKDPWLVVFPNPVGRLLGIPTPDGVMETFLRDPQNFAKVLDYKDPFMILGAPLATAIQSARSNARAAGVNDVPNDILLEFSGDFGEQVIRAVKWRVDQPMHSSVVATLAFHAGAAAVTLEDTIIFVNDAAARDFAIWGHELFHVKQYYDMGTLEFAKEYTVNHQGIEGPAYEFQKEYVRYKNNQTSRPQYSAPIPGRIFNGDVVMIRATSSDPFLRLSNRGLNGPLVASGPAGTATPFVIHCVPRSDNNILIENGGAIVLRGMSGDPYVRVIGGNVVADSPPNGATTMVIRAPNSGDREIKDNDTVTIRTSSGDFYWTSGGGSAAGPVRAVDGVTTAGKFVIRKLAGR